MGSRLDIDLRPEFVPPCDQGEVWPTCLAFKATAAHEYARQLPIRLCVEYLYFTTGGETTGVPQPIRLTPSSVGVSLRERGYPAEWLRPCDTNRPTTPSARENLDPLSCAPDIHDSAEAVITSVGGSVPVVLALEITSVWNTNLVPEYIMDDRLGNSSQGSPIGHAALPIGVREDEVPNWMILV